MLDNGIDISGQRARQLAGQDFDGFDLIVAMDRSNRKDILKLGPEADVELLLSFAPELNMEDVPDPYYGGYEGFERVVDLVSQASERLLFQIKEAKG